MEALAAATDMFPRFLAQAFALADQRPAALRWLRIAIDRGFINYPFLARHDPCLKRLRRDARFQRLLRLTRRALGELPGLGIATLSAAGLWCHAADCLNGGTVDGRAT